MRRRIEGPAPGAGSGLSCRAVLVFALLFIITNVDGMRNQSERVSADFFRLKIGFFSMRHRLTGVHEPHKRFAPNGRQPFSLHRLSGVRELPQACSPWRGGSFLCTG